MESKRKSLERAVPYDCGVDKPYSKNVHPTLTEAVAILTELSMDECVTDKEVISNLLGHRHYLHVRCVTSLAWIA